jgi:hypothetical protein
VISLRTKLLAAAVFLSALSLAGLWLLVLAGGKTGYSHLLLALPSSPHSPSIGVKEIERFCEDELPLTYEIPRAERAAVSMKEYPVILLATNAVYQRLLGYPLTEGSFFSKQAWDRKERHAVLNEKAAFDLFGSRSITGALLKIRGETWIVSGVIRDGDEDECRVYVPSSVQGGEALFLLALINPQGGLSAAYIKNRLPSLGVREGDFEFYDLGAAVLAAPLTFPSFPGYK